MHRSSDTIKFRLATLVLFISSFLLATLNDAVLADPGFVPPGLNRAMEVQKAHTQTLLKKPGVVGTAVGLGPDGGPVVQVYTEQAGMVPLPKFLDGIQVQEIAVGQFHALEACDRAGLPIPLCQPDISNNGRGNGRGGGGGGSEETTGDPTARFPRPVPLGVSTGNKNECSAGTIGARLETNYALSNNHVFALVNNGQAGDGIVQPGLYDTNCIYDSADQLGTLHDFKPISFSEVNYIDAAVAHVGPTNLGVCTPSDGYGSPNPMPYPASLEPIGGLLNVLVQKYGRTTSLTTGTIVSINWTGNVGYSTGTALFEDQIMVYGSGKFVKGGDSGSLVVDESKGPKGLLFAGDRSGRYGIVNRIDLVLNQFERSLDGGGTCG